MYCWNCGHKNPNENKFCGECGKVQMRPPEFAEVDQAASLISQPVSRPAGPPAPVNMDRHQAVTGPAAQPSHGEQKPSQLIQPVQSAPLKSQPTQPATVAKLPISNPAASHRVVGSNPLADEPWMIKDSLPAAAPLAKPRSVPPPKPVALATANTLPPAIRPTRISGPSFLGLSDGPPSESDYLLEDEGERSYWRFYLALALLILFGVLAYKQWDSMNAAGKALLHRASVAAGVATTVNPATPSASASDSVEETADHSAETTPAATGTVDADGTTQEKSLSADKSSAESAPVVTDANETAAEPALGKTSKDSAAPAAAAAVASTSAPVYDNSAVDLAQKYLQGRGVAQDCERGVSLLRSAAAQPNPAAQIKLGALFASGFCVTQDRAEAYRWFAEAKQIQPGNQWIERNLNSLWSDMSASERSRVER